MIIIVSQSVAHKQIVCIAQPATAGRHRRSSARQSTRDRSWLCIRAIIMRRVRIWGWARTRRCDEPLNDLGPSSRHQSYPDCIIATHGYDFREGQV